MFSITENDIDPQALKAQLENPYCGALVCFEGWVRNHHEGQSVDGLYYQAYQELAMHEGTRIINLAKESFAIEHASCCHRVGQLGIGDMAVWVGVASAHRQPAFEAAAFIMDTIKESLPIWKQESYSQSHKTWRMA